MSKREHIAHLIVVLIGAALVVASHGCKLLEEHMPDELPSAADVLDISESVAEDVTCVPAWLDKDPEKALAAALDDFDARGIRIEYVPRTRYLTAIPPYLLKAPTTFKLRSAREKVPLLAHESCHFFHAREYGVRVWLSTIASPKGGAVFEVAAEQGRVAAWRTFGWSEEQVARGVDRVIIPALSKYPQIRLYGAGRLERLAKGALLR